MEYKSHDPVPFQEVAGIIEKYKKKLKANENYE